MNKKVDPPNFFDMVILNNFGRFHLVGDVIDGVSSLDSALENQSVLLVREVIALWIQIRQYLSTNLY